MPNWTTIDLYISGSGGAPAGQIWHEICAEPTADQMRRLTFMFDVQRYTGWDAACLPFLTDEEEALLPGESVRSHVNLAFLEADGRCFYELDRRLMWAIAHHLGSNWDTQKTETELENEFLMVQTPFSYSEDELYEWASHALFRPGCALDLTDHDALWRGFVAYAFRMHKQTLDHLCHRQPEGI